MSGNPNYPPQDVAEASLLLEGDTALFHDVLNGSAEETITVDNGNTLPSLRKSLVDNFYFLDPINWFDGGYVNKFNQLVKFIDGTIWYAPLATETQPVIMQSTPIGDVSWRIFTAGGNGTGGGGGLSPFVYKTSSFTIEDKVSYALEMGDDIQKVATIPDGFLEGASFAIAAFNWTGHEGVSFLVSTETEEWNSSSGVVDSSTRSIRVSQNCTVYFQKINGKWSVVDGVGEIGSSLPYNDILERLVKLESKKSGFHNILYNTGHDLRYKPINQRGFGSNWDILATGDYGFDGWLKYDATHKAQIIELGNFEDTDYVISYDGASIKTIRPPNGTTEPWLVAVPFGVDKIDLRPSGGYGYWQVEDNERVLAICQRHYYLISGRWHCTVGGTSTYFNIPRPVTMRSVPISTYAASSVGVTTIIGDVTSWTVEGTGSTIYVDRITADASFTIAEAGTNISIVN